MIKFGLVGLKNVCYGLNLILLACGGYLLGVAVQFNTKWKDADHILGKFFNTSPDIAFWLGIIIVCVAILGFLAIFYCRIRILTFYILVLCLLLPTVIVCGFFLYCDGYSEYSSNHIRINAFIRGMSPIRLHHLQFTFHCCGIEKYTDYYLLWSLWGMEPTILEPVSKTTRSTKKVSGPQTIYTPVTAAKPGGSGGVSSAPGKSDENDIITTEQFEPPTLDELDVILGYYQDPNQVEKYHTSKLPILAKKVQKINAWMDQQFTNLRKKLSKWVKVNVEYVQKYTPVLMVSAVRNFLKTVYNVYRYNENPDDVALRWMSGWDELIFTDIKLTGLPISCCKNPKTIKERCLGLAHDTWREGCRKRVPAYYQLKVYQFAIVVLCTIPIIFTTVIVTAIYRAGLVEHYSF